MSTMNRRGILSTLLGAIGIATSATLARPSALGSGQLVEGTAGVASLGEIGSTGLSVGLGAFPTAPAGIKAHDAGVPSIDKNKWGALAPEEYQILAYNCDTHESSTLPGKYTQMAAIDELWQRAREKRVCYHARRKIEIKLWDDGEEWKTTSYTYMYYRRDTHADNVTSLTLVIE